MLALVVVTLQHLAGVWNVPLAGQGIFGELWNSELHSSMSNIVGEGQGNREGAEL